MHRKGDVACIAVRHGDSASRRDRQDSCCVLRVQLRDLPAATVVEVGGDAYATINRAVDRVGRWVEAQLHGAGAAQRRGTSLDGIAA